MYNCLKRREVDAGDCECESEWECSVKSCDFNSSSDDGDDMDVDDGDVVFESVDESDDGLPMCDCCCAAVLSLSNLSIISTSSLSPNANTKQIMTSKASVHFIPFDK